jgi:hypothetical protein
LEKTLREKKKRAYVKTRTGEDLQVKYNSEINIFIESELKNELEKIELITMHIDYLEQTVKTIDQMIYGIKSRIDIETLLNR